MKKILLLMAIVLPFVLISCGDDKDEPESPDNHEWIDLGLPSGTLWATCNIGANKPEEYGTTSLGARRLLRKSILMTTTNGPIIQSITRQITRLSWNLRMTQPM